MCDVPPKLVSCMQMSSANTNEQKQANTGRPKIREKTPSLIKGNFDRLKSITSLFKAIGLADVKI